MAQKQCPECGAYLDPEERCDCMDVQQGLGIELKPRKDKKIIVEISGKGTRFYKYIRS